MDLILSSIRTDQISFECKAQILAINLRDIKEQRNQPVVLSIVKLCIFYSLVQDQLNLFYRSNTSHAVICLPLDGCL